MALEEFRDTGLYCNLPHKAALKQFQVFGERASATNLVRKLIEKNVQIDRTSALGWKHAAPHMVAIPNDTVVVAVVRDAESWALSMHKRPWHLTPQLQAFEFSKFIRNRWIGVVDRPTDFSELPKAMHKRVKGLPLQLDRHPITGRPYENLFHMRSIKLAALLGLLNRHCNVMLVKAETVQADPPAFVNWFADQLQLPRKSEKFAGVTRRMGHRHRLKVDPALRGETPKVMSPRDRSFMVKSLDMPLEALLGYDYADPAEEAAE